MGEIEKMTPKEKRIALHLRIWLVGFIALVFYIGINYFISDEYPIDEVLFQAGIFYAAWVIVNYLIYRKTFKQLREESDKDSNG
ncbi:MAG: hypothetical protein ACLFUQ_05760 [Candidatus Izemoplasmataceae bacterium]